MSKILMMLSRNKKALVLIIGIGLFLTFLPLHFAQASWWDDLLEFFTGIGIELALLPVIGPFLFGAFIVAHLAVLASYIFYAFCTFLLTWVTSDFFVSLPFTKEGIVGPGVALTTGIVNLGFILILVFIALATILRLESYGFKKLLPKFLFIVLLINFVPVICGIIIDIANIVTKSFLFPNLGNDFLAIFGPATPLGTIIKAFIDFFSGEKFEWEILWDLLTQFLTIQGLIGLFLKALTVTLFGLFAGFVILLYVLLFMIRIIALWLLVILAPIAWFCLILPLTQKFFRMWWNYFLQWAFVGAIAGFFLWLGKGLVAIAVKGLAGQGPGVFGAIPPVTEPGIGAILQALLSPLITTFNYIFVFGAIMAFLVIGFILSLKLAGGGTEAVLKWGEKMGKTAAVVGGVAATRWAGRKAGPAIQKAGKELKEVGIKMPEERWKKIMTYPFLKPAEVISKSRIGAWGTRAIGTGLEMAGSEIAARTKGAEARDIEASSDEIVKTAKTKEEKANIFKRAIGPLAKAKAIYALLKADQFDDAVEAGLIDIDREKARQEARKYAKTMWDRDIKTPARWLADEEMAKMTYPEEWQKGLDILVKGKKTEESGKDLFKQAEAVDDVVAMAKAATIQAEGLAQQEEGKNIHKDAMKKLLGKIKPSDIQHMSEDSLRDETVKRVIVDTFSGTQMAEIARNFGRDIVNGIQEEIEKRGKTPEGFEKWAEENPSSAIWIFGPAAMNLGFRPPRGVSQLTREQAGRVVGSARARAETTRSGQKAVVRTQYTGKEQMMFRDYYRKDVQEEIKGLIKEIIVGAGKKFPTEAEIKRRIESFEKQYNDLEKELRTLREGAEKAEKRFNELSAIPGTPPADLAAAQKEMTDALDALRTGKTRIDLTQQTLLQQEETELKDLW